MVHHLNDPRVSIDGTVAATKAGNPLLTLVKEIVQLHHELSILGSLSPDEHVTALFTKLVQICTFSYTQDASAVLEHPSILTLLPSLRRLASRGEYELELAWAKQTTEPVERFLYYKNYKDLVQLEIHSLLGVGALLNRVVFIGSGPLPLSAILMYQNLKAETIHTVDRDSESIEVSNQLLGRLKIPLIQHQMEAVDYPYENVDTVILGALVDDKKELLKIMNQKMKRGSILMARSAHSLRTLLYPSLDPADVNRCGFETLLVSHPYNEIVNSILIARKL
ncbi:hypothetical protein G6F56_011689 [Rhizopus delemar]|uniref:Putative 26S proteasome regulatory subunit n=1 Tax=Rhizopus stolonifer TaxID=4846 RepID=A0A367JCB1_RHIST|nr:hypothetical protein G6F56_011689 [Rhizopus delemar]RCH87525.1 putative 26S proteasome regulatory subunit [Rhizopus stolonifer]